VIAATVTHILSSNYCVRGGYLHTTVYCLPSSPDHEQQQPLDVTNPHDEEFKLLLDALEERIEATKEATSDESVAKSVIADCDSLLAKAASPRALFIKGKSLNVLAKIKRSNPILEDAINTLYQVVSSSASNNPVPLKLMEEAGSLCVQLMMFRGWNMRAVQTQKILVKKFGNDDVSKRNRLGVLHLLSGQNAEAGDVFEAVLADRPDNGFAMVHLGFVLKLKATGNSGKTPVTSSEKLLERAVDLLTRGIESGDNDVMEGKFFFHLGDGLRRLGRSEDADKVYRAGADKGMFLSFWQRSLYNVNGLKAQPVWPLHETGVQRELEALAENWREIQTEAISIFREGLFAGEGESLQDTGRWSQFELYRQGRKSRQGCAKAPKTCALVDALGPAVTTNRRGQVKFSVMEAGTHVHAHSGPTNCRLRVHLGLKVPEVAVVAPPSSRLRVADQTLTWNEGQIFVFDDSFDHEVWHDNPQKEARIILILDIWHPQLSASQRDSLPAI